MNVAELAKRYYADFASKGDFESVPMADDLRFSGPIHAYVDGDRYRRECAKLASGVRGITIRHQFVDGDRVHTVYDFDVGLPGGPIPSSETLSFANGMLVAADLIIDSTPLRPAPNDA
jgi:hypothetical protein